MKNLILLLAVLWLTRPCACAEESDNSYDHFTGWFEFPIPVSDRRQMHLPSHKIIVPVIKRGTNFFTAFLGFEVPFQKTGEGLYLEADNSMTQQRMMIGFRPDSGDYCARIIKRPAHYDYSSPERAQEGQIECILVKTNRPPCALDAAISAPRTFDDFVGWYQSFYMPTFRVEVHSEDGKFYFAQDGQSHFGADGKFYSDRPFERTGRGEELVPCKDGPGFLMKQQDGSESFSFGYNTDLKRFELCSTTVDPPVRIPFARIGPLSPQSTDEAMSMTRLGFPFMKD